VRYVHPAFPGRFVHLCYCLNVAPAEDLAGVEEVIRRVALPLRARFDPSGLFGVGLYLPARAAFELALPGGAAGAFAARLVDGGLHAFTFNAFPFGGFHRPGLKEGVFAPPWHDLRRREYTLAVASIAERCARAASKDRGGHVSISTHAGGFGAAGRARAAEGFGEAAAALLELGAETGVHVVLAIEPEPRSAANDTREFIELARSLRSAGADAAADAGGLEPAQAEAAVTGHLGLCLDACHAAVEFEAPEVAVGAAREAGHPLGKLQLSNALALRDPGSHDAARARFLALDEPVFLHQTTAQTRDGSLLRARDLGEVNAALVAGERTWLDALEWRCHFHVPVHLGPAIASGLGTTADHAADLLARALGDPSLWGTRDLHLEVETYTFDVLPREARGAGELVDVLERETRHAIDGLHRAGWALG